MRLNLIFWERRAEKKKAMQNYRTKGLWSTNIGTFPPPTPRSFLIWRTEVTAQCSYGLRSPERGICAALLGLWLTPGGHRLQGSHLPLPFFPFHPCSTSYFEHTSICLPNNGDCHPPPWQKPPDESCQSRRTKEIGNELIFGVLLKLLDSDLHMTGGHFRGS